MSEAEEKRIDNFLSRFDELQQSYNEFSCVVKERILEALKDRNIFVAFSSCRVKTRKSLEKSAKRVFGMKRKES